MGADELARQALAALREGRLSEALSLALIFAGKYGRQHTEAWALCAHMLLQAGHARQALDCWDEAVTRKPHRVGWLERALRTAWKVGAKEHVDRYRTILRNIFLTPPAPAFLEELDRRGEGLSGSCGIHAGYLRAWIWLPQGKNVAISTTKGAPSLPPGNMKKNSVGGHTLCELSIPLVVHRTAYFVTLTVDGKHIPGSPVVCSSCDAARPAGRSPSPEVTVLMPCYDGYAETLSCIGSVLASFRRNTRRVRLFVMWDHGPDTRLWEALRRLAARKKIVLESTPVNMGFLGCVNHALSRVSGGDVILLNADTLVHGDWVDRMAAIARREDAGTVTALGSDAELCSFPAPHDRGDVRTLSDVAVLDSACASLPPSWQVREIPVGVGFCLYLPRRALERLGGLDGLRVFRGYGEETDFCLRVAESGLKNYVACNVYVAHLGGRSFGAAKKALAAQNNRALFARYSDYDADYDKFLLENALGDVNDRISRRACRYAGGTLHARAWGEQFLKTERKIPGAHCFGLACGGGVRVILRLYQGIKLADMHFVLPEEYDEWRQLVQRCGFTHMSVHGEHVWAEQLAKACAIEVQPSKEPLAELTALEPATGDNVILATPLTMSQWQRCCDLARRKPEVTFWAPSLNKTWGGAPRPGNMVPLPEMESLRAFNPDSLIFTEIPELGTLELWRVWLEDHDLVKVPAGIVSTEVA